MTNFVPLLDTAPTSSAQADIELFDPPMCCPTGLCGPTLDQALLDLNEMLLGLETEGIKVVRHQMTSSPQAFLNNAQVMQLVREKQMAALPITVIRGKVIKSAEYPSLAEIKSHLNGATI